MSNKEDFKRQYQKGMGILLLEMKDNISPVPPGTLGIIEYIDDLPQCHMKWDNRRTLPIIEDDLYIPFYTGETVFSQDTSLGRIQNCMCISKELVRRAVEIAVSKILDTNIELKLDFEEFDYWDLERLHDSFSVEELKVIIDSIAGYTDHIDSVRAESMPEDSYYSKSLGMLLSEALFRSMFGKYNIDIFPINKDHFIIITREKYI